MVTLASATSSRHPAPEPDGAAADWWLHQLASLWRPGVPVRSLFPECFPAVAQVLHPWRDEPPPHGRPVRWRDLASRQGFDSVEELDRTRDEHDRIPAVHEAGLYGFAGELDEFTAATLVEVLSAATATPEDVFVAVWVGWGDVPVQRFPDAARLDTQSRGHFLLRGPLAGVLTSVAASGRDRPAAGLWWPADRAWFVATEVDFEWTFVAGSDALVDRMINDARLEAARTTFDASANAAVEPA